MDGITRARWVGALFLGFLFLVNLYRAATQSITCDEAFSWVLYLSQPVASVFHTFDANNHLLATLSFWASVHLFSQNELSMRLPSLLGGAWYMVSLYLLYSRVIRKPLLFLLALAVSTLNPLILDFMVAARGYGIALAGLTFALLALVDHLAGDRRHNLYLAALGVCLSIGSNLAFAIPCGMLIATFLIINAVSRGKKSTLLEAGHVVLPVAVFCAAIYFVFPIHKAKRGDFYVGFTSAWDSFRNLIQVSFHHNGYIGDPHGPSTPVTIYLTLVAITAIAVLCWVVYRIAAGYRESAFLLSAGTLFGSMLALFLAHQLTGLLYPVDRTGLYFLALVPILVVSANSKWMRAVAALVLVAFLCQWNTRFFYVWRFDADTKTILETLEHRESRAPVRLGISWPLYPSVSFYRATRGYTRLAPVDLRGPDGVYDYYIITPPMTDLKLNDDGVIAKRLLEVLYRGEVSRTVLAAGNTRDRLP